jgi:hypothetical protein
MHFLVWGVVLMCLFCFVCCCFTPQQRYVSHIAARPTCDSVKEGGYLHLYSVASLKYNAASMITLQPTQSHYTDTEPISSLPYPCNVER